MNGFAGDMKGKAVITVHYIGPHQLGCDFSTFFPQYQFLSLFPTLFIVLVINLTRNPQKSPDRNMLERME